MKNLLLVFLIVALTPCATLFSQDKTAANFTEAYRFESANSQLFDAYAKQATDEGLPKIALFFHAIAKTSSIHASNLKDLLSGMGVQVAPVKQTIILKTPKIHLDEALKSIRIQAGIKYAEYIQQAESDHETSAVAALKRIKESEQQNLEIYLKVMKALRNDIQNTLPDTYFICPTCGNLYTAEDSVENCRFCSTEKEKFIKLN